MAVLLLVCTVVWRRRRRARKAGNQSIEVHDKGLSFLVAKGKPRLRTRRHHSPHNIRTSFEIRVWALCSAVQRIQNDLGRSWGENADKSVVRSRFFATNGCKLYIGSGSSQFFFLVLASARIARLRELRDCEQKIVVLLRIMVFSHRSTKMYLDKRFSQAEQKPWRI